ncbi:tRNA (cytidine(34)-2'-O)-methyltransferase [Sarracenia purpurea var. burkii]
MDSSTGLKAFHVITTPLHLRSRAFLFPPLQLPQFKKKFTFSLSSHSHFSPLCLFSIGGDSSSLAGGAGEAVGQASQNKLLQVVLVSPQIPGNTGCIARTCAASAVGLHLVGPLGFQVDDTKLKRAGLDYWPYVVVKVHDSWTEFRNYYNQQDGEKRLLAFTKRGTTIHSDFSYRRGDWLVFGSETCGLPPEVLLDCKDEAFGAGTIRIPMVETYVRCLNLSVSVGIALYEASRQLNYVQLQGGCPQTCMDGGGNW